MPNTVHGAQPTRPPEPASVKSRAAHFTACPAKPFEATVGRILFSLDGGANQAFGAALDKSPAWVSRIKDPGDATHIRASDVAHVCQALGEVTPVNELFRGVRIGGSEWRLAPVPETASSEDLRLDSMQLAGAAGGYVAALGHALSDGKLTRGERSELSGRLEVLREQVEQLIAGLAGGAS